jgi:tetratricopeptide (TPR) repeat protein
LDRSVGNAAYDQKNWPTAIEAYTAAIAAGAADPDLYTDLGTAYRFNNQPQLALQEYQAAQAKWPAHENSLFNQGGVYAFSLNEPDQAIKAWQSYLLKFPNGSHVADAEQLIANVKAHMIPASKPG